MEKQKHRTVLKMFRELHILHLICNQSNSYSYTVQMLLGNKTLQHNSQKRVNGLWKQIRDPGPSYQDCSRKRCELLVFLSKTVAETDARVQRPLHVDSNDHTFETPIRCYLQKQ